MKRLYCMLFILIRALPAACAEQAAGGWEFFTLPPEEETPAPQAEASGAALPEASGTEAGAAGMTYPLMAEVVNCKKAVSLREEPSTKAALLAEVPLGALVYVYANTAYSGNDRWFVEAGYSGQRGYICIEYLDVMLPADLRFQTGWLSGMPGTVSAVNSGTDLILRAGPGLDYEPLGLLFGGEVLGYAGDAARDDSGTCWYHCSHYGEDCWISAKYTALTLNDGTTYTGGKGIY